jgi:hypothetical protein
MNSLAINPTCAIISVHLENKDWEYGYNAGLRKAKEFIEEHFGVEE